MIEFKCTGCDAKLEVHDTQAGHKIVCPQCKSVLDVPGSDIPHMGVLCNNCGNETSFDISLGGTMQRCPHCGSMVVVPKWGGEGETGGCLGLFGTILIIAMTGLAGAVWLVQG
jgi:DNA-directed RNA polymerase subunit RPC12/RpoP